MTPKIKYEEKIKDLVNKGKVFLKTINYSNENFLSKVVCITQRKMDGN